MPKRTLAEATPMTEIRLPALCSDTSTQPSTYSYAPIPFRNLELVSKKKEGEKKAKKSKKKKSERDDKHKQVGKERSKKGGSGGRSAKQHQVKPGLTKLTLALATLCLLFTGVAATPERTEALERDLHFVAGPSPLLTLALAAALAPSVAAYSSPLFAIYVLENDQTMESSARNERFWKLVVPALGHLPPRVAEVLFNGRALIWAAWGDVCLGAPFTEYADLLSMYDSDRPQAALARHYDWVGADEPGQRLLLCVLACDLVEGGAERLVGPGTPGAIGILTHQATTSASSRLLGRSATPCPSAPATSSPASPSSSASGPTPTASRIAASRPPASPTFSGTPPTAPPPPACPSPSSPSRPATL